MKPFTVTIREIAPIPGPYTFDGRDLENLLTELGIQNRDFRDKIHLQLVLEMHGYEIKRQDQKIFPITDHKREDLYSVPKKPGKKSRSKIQQIIHLPNGKTKVIRK